MTSRALLLLLLLALPGCAWWKQRVNAPQAPLAFQGAPTIEQIAQHINSNAVRQLEADRAKISLDGLPALTARLHLERPRNLRFRVETALTGTELDIGSNPERFWIWAKREGVAYYARHDEFAGSTARRMVPIQPDWITEALGIMYFDPAGRHEGPFERGNHRVEIRSKLLAPDGEITRVMIVNNVYGWILEQHLYDSRNQLLASSKTSQHRYYPADGVSLPHKVEIQLPPAQLAFTLDVSEYRINQLSAAPEQLFAMPSFEGSQLVNVADPNFIPPGTSKNTPATWAQEPRTSGLPNVRGMR
jgi:hypothetical protein